MLDEVLQASADGDVAAKRKRYLLSGGPCFQEAAGRAQSADVQPLGVVNMLVENSAGRQCSGF